MGQLRFLVPPNYVSPCAIETAYLCGMEQLPWVGEVTLAGDQLVVEREVNESGSFHILWPVEGRGTLMLSTATLLERAEPYDLSVELARGTLNRLRNEVATLQMAGLALPKELNTHDQESLQNFVKAATLQEAPAEAAQHAQRSIAAALFGLDIVSGAVAERILQVQQRQASRTIPLLGCRLRKEVPHRESRVTFMSAFNTAMVPFSWGRIESDEGRKRWTLADAHVQWCQKRGLRICGGPLLELQRHSLPDWLFLWEGDFENLLSVASDHLRAVVARYKGQVAFWNAAGRLITGDVLGLDEEHKLRLAGTAIEVVRSVDPNTPIVVSFDQPWGEYLAHRESELPPLHFADMMVRADVGLAGIVLEMNVGLEKTATLPRDRFEFEQLIERWSTLGVPIILSVSVPSEGSGFTPQTQRTWLETYVPILLSRPIVQGLFWNQLFDAEAEDFPGTGLIDAAGAHKPAFDVLPALRKQYSA